MCFDVRCVVIAASRSQKRALLHTFVKGSVDWTRRGGKPRTG
jgi:hypothetical protein